MEPTLIRVLSTGRVGTKFVAAAFSDQGYRAFHENLYAGEPGSAIIQYMRMLGDLWMENRDKYYELESNFAKPYIKTVLEVLDIKSAPLGSLRSFFQQKGKRRVESVVVHTANVLTPATPLIEKEAERCGLAIKTLILFRNPLKTIHAIYTVESPSSEWGGPYHNWSSSFFSDSGVQGAADIWANTYRLALDQQRYYGVQRFRIFRLEDFSSDPRYAKQVFEFAGLNFDQRRFETFYQAELNKPFRVSKVDSIRNSHLFHNPDFVFSQMEIDAIFAHIKDVIADYEIDWEASVRDYIDFHTKEKTRIGFA